MQSARFVVDPRDPRAPTQDLWDKLSEDERRIVFADLPSEWPRAMPP